ncbi:MDR/zinc-dependent alcohol dehydrogenase-like family protein [Pacificimonas flava]|uniref:Threonine dehydrogenase n=1 Tax=Pacificimonas flava TaxID=1234595 RepID=M2SD56_9SPHN|nr:zinc-binding dehydrogenase [Pacificimonas flava]EMD83290.1 Threonine dehydrogenase [Pacificimonas flava]MBB5279150.1 threonine dehydrogenase-like Zn-dependent dehydrogenase [Pacificimonas flava]
MTAPGRIEIVDAPLPEPGPGQVRIRLQGCGVCASNLGPWAGPPWMEFPTEPGAMGHEGWGLVDKIGPSVSGIEAGMRVATLSGSSFAEYDLAAEDEVLPLPQALSDQPVPGEPLGCAMNIFRRSDVQPGMTVAIVGIGFLGALLTGLCKDAGASVIAISRRDFSLDLARRYGADHVLSLGLGRAAIGEAVGKLTDGAGCARVIEAVGMQDSLDLSGDLVAEGGRLVVAGYHQDGPRQVNMQMWNWKGIDVVNAHERDPAVQRRGVTEAIAAMESGRIDPAPLLTHRYALERLGDALDGARDRADGFVKAWVTFD